VVLGFSLPPIVSQTGFRSQSNQFYRQVHQSDGLSGVPHHTAKSGFALALVPLNNLSSLKLTCKDEELQWAEVASRLPNVQLWQSAESLIERKIISKKSAEDFGHTFLAGNATLRSQAILNGVVIPYLRGELNCQ
jgi:hypothetical protein